MAGIVPSAYYIRMIVDLILVPFGVAVDVVGGRVGNLAALFRSRF